jgi:hypothetical protein
VNAARKEALAFQSSLAHAIDTAAMKSRNDRALTEIRETIERQEKEHRALGRRMVGPGAMKGHATLREACDHFVCRVVAEGFTTYKRGKAPIKSLHGIRADYVMGAILASDPRFQAELLVEIARRFPGRSTASVLKAASEYDYCKMIVGES